MIGKSAPLLKGFAFSVALLAAGPAWAQNDFPRFEVFGGWSYLPANGDDFPRQNSTGFQAGLTVNVNRWFGVVADLGGQYSNASWDRGPGVPSLSTKTSVYEYAVG